MSSVSLDMIVNFKVLPKTCFKIPCSHVCKISLADRRSITTRVSGEQVFVLLQALNQASDFWTNHFAYLKQQKEDGLAQGRKFVVPSKEIVEEATSIINELFLSSVYAKKTKSKL